MTTPEILDMIDMVIRYRIGKRLLRIDDYLFTFDDLRSELYLASIEAVNKFKQKKEGKLKAWLFYKLNFEVINYHKKVHFFSSRSYGKAHKYNSIDNHEFVTTENVKQIENSILFNEMTRFLNPREFVALNEFFFKERNMRNQNKKYTVSEERMRQVKNEALKKLRKIYCD